MTLITINHLWNFSVLGCSRRESNSWYFDVHPETSNLQSLLPAQCCSGCKYNSYFFCSNMINNAERWFSARHIWFPTPSVEFLPCKGLSFHIFCYVAIEVKADDRIPALMLDSFYLPVFTLTALGLFSL